VSPSCEHHQLQYVFSRRPGEKEENGTILNPESRCAVTTNATTTIVIVAVVVVVVVVVVG